MTFLLGKLVDMLSEPGTLLLLCNVVGLSLLWRGKDTIGRVLLLVGTVGFVVILLLPVGQWALMPLEDRFPRVTDAPAHVDGIIVLGGAVMPDMSADRGIPSLNDGAERMTTGVMLALRYPTARLVFTGGRGRIIPGATSEAEVARTLFVSLGIPPDRLTMEDASRTTYENAVMTKALARPLPGQTWLLVTSAWHMPRSVGVFRAAGWHILAWPVAYKSGHGHYLGWPTTLGEHLMQLDAATHEWIGLIAYRLMGRTERLFPGPD